MGIVQVTPKPESYCTEWTALKFNAVEGMAAAKKLLKGSPWSLYIVVGDTVDPYLVFQDGHSGPQTVHHGEWIVKSPHGKFWFMPEEEFLSQFEYEPES